MKIITFFTTLFALFFSTFLSAELKITKDLSYGPNERNVLDIYWDTEYENAPIVFTIHGGGFRFGDKTYCNEDMIKLYMSKGCIVVSPNYRLLKTGTGVSIKDCVLDSAMAVAYIQKHAEKYGGNPKKIVSTGASAGGFISAWIAYNDEWEWPTYAKYKPKKLNIVGWFGNSPGLPPNIINLVNSGDPPGFVMFGGKKEHPKTPASMGHAIQAMLTKNKVWSKMVYIDSMGHVPAKRVLFNPKTRDKETYTAFNDFLDMVCHNKKEPKGGDVIKVKKK
jgi:predicted esterase